MTEAIFLALFTIFSGAVAKLWFDVTKLNELLRKETEAHSKCTLELAVQSGKIDLLQKSIANMEKTIHRLSSMSQSNVPYAVITINAEGIITDANDDIKCLVGWRAAELINKNIDVIIPDDYLVRHHNVGPDVFMKGFALHQDKSRIPVMISLTNVTAGEARLVKIQLFNIELP